MERCSSPLGHGLGELWVTVAWLLCQLCVEDGWMRLARKYSDGVSVIHSLDYLQPLLKEKKIMISIAGICPGHNNAKYNYTATTARIVTFSTTYSVSA